MLRKKSCDKALPSCQFCTSRNLPCRYDTSTAKKGGKRKYNPGRNFVLSTISQHAQDVTQQLPSPVSLNGNIVSEDQLSLCMSLPQPVDETLNIIVQHFLELTNMTSDFVIDGYLQAFSRWLPAVSCDSVRREGLQYRKERRLPRAHYNVLILAMLLNILPTLGRTARPSLAVQALLYTATKSAFAQVQTSTCTSLRLAQAALLIALREYACIRPDAAYVSVMTCTAMVQLLGGKSSSTETYADDPRTDSSLSAPMHIKGLTIAVALCERYDQYGYGRLRELELMMVSIAG